MIGYKGFNENLQGYNNFQFIEGKTFVLYRLMFLNFIIKKHVNMLLLKNYIYDNMRFIKNFTYIKIKILSLIIIECIKKIVI